MDMEQRKVTWANRIHGVLGKTGDFRPMTIRQIVSICQDAFNEGHTAGYAKGHEEGYSERDIEAEEMD